MRRLWVWKREEKKCIICCVKVKLATLVCSKYHVTNKENRVNDFPLTVNVFLSLSSAVFAECVFVCECATDYFMLLHSQVMCPVKAFILHLAPLTVTFSTEWFNKIDQMSFHENFRWNRIYIFKHSFSLASFFYSSSPYSTQICDHFSR